MLRQTLILLSLTLVLLVTKAAMGQETPKPKVAVFPLNGTSEKSLRDRIGASLRAKLNRDGAYIAIDGPAMSDLVADVTSPINSSTNATDVEKLAIDTGAVVLFWGDVQHEGQADHLKLNMLDTRKLGAKPVKIDATISDPTQVRFFVESVLEKLPGVTPFEHPNELAVQPGEAANHAFAAAANLVTDGDFASAGHWTALYQLESYALPVQNDLPPVDKVAIVKADGSAALAMNLSKECAENNGMACLSDPMPIEVGARYRVAFEYKSDAPHTHVFVKGYTTGKDSTGHTADREVYRLQVPPGAETGGKWVSVAADLNPQGIGFPVERLRVDLYAYLKPGMIYFRNVQIKRIGDQNVGNVPKDDAIKMPTTRQMRDANLPN